MRYISPLSETTRSKLQDYLCNKLLRKRERKRFSAILLSSDHKMNIEELSKVFDVSRNSVATWLDKYDSEGLKGLLDENLIHKKSTLSSFESSIILNSVAASPQNLSMAVADLHTNHQITTNKNILKNYLKKKNSVGNE